MWESAFRGMSRIPGEDAREWMFDEYEDAMEKTWLTAGHLGARSDLTTGDRSDLATMDDRDIAIFFKLLFKTPDAVSSAIKLARTGDRLERTRVASWALSFDRREMEPALWDLLSYSDPYTYPYDAFARQKYCDLQRIKSCIYR